MPSPQRADNADIRLPSGVAHPEASTLSASRIGVRETPNCSHSSRSGTLLPDASTPSTIRGCNRSINQVSIQEVPMILTETNFEQLWQKVRRRMAGHFRRTFCQRGQNSSRPSGYVHFARYTAVSSLQRQPACAADETLISNKMDKIKTVATSWIDT